MTTIEYSIDGKFAGNDKFTRNLTDLEIHKVVCDAQRELAPIPIEVTIKQEQTCVK